MSLETRGYPVVTPKKQQYRYQWVKADVRSTNTNHNTNYQQHFKLINNSNKI